MILHSSHTNGQMSLCYLARYTVHNSYQAFLWNIYSIITIDWRRRTESDGNSSDDTCNILSSHYIHMVRTLFLFGEHILYGGNNIIMWRTHIYIVRTLYLCGVHVIFVCFAHYMYMLRTVYSYGVHIIFIWQTHFIWRKHYIYLAHKYLYGAHIIFMRCTRYIYMFRTVYSYRAHIIFIYCTHYVLRCREWVIVV